MQSNKSLDERVADIEGAMSARDELNPQLNEISEALSLVRGILVDLVASQPNAAEYADDLERLDVIARFLP